MVGWFPVVPVRWTYRATRVVLVAVLVLVLVAVAGCSGSDETTAPTSSLMSRVPASTVVVTSVPTPTATIVVTTTVVAVTRSPVSAAPTTVVATTAVPSTTAASSTTLVLEPEPMTEGAVRAALDDYTRILNECFADASNCDPTTLEARASGRRLEADITAYGIVQGDQAIDDAISVVRMIVPASVEMSPEGLRATVSICMRDTVPSNGSTGVRSTTRLIAVHDGWVWKFDDAVAGPEREVEC